MEEPYRGDAEKGRETYEDATFDRHPVRTSGRSPVYPMLQVPEGALRPVPRTVQSDDLFGCQQTVRQEHELSLAASYHTLRRMVYRLLLRETIQREHVRQLGIRETVGVPVLLAGFLPDIDVLPDDLHLLPAAFRLPHVPCGNIRPRLLVPKDVPPALQIALDQLVRQDIANRYPIAFVLIHGLIVGCIQSDPILFPPTLRSRKLYLYVLANIQERRPRGLFGVWSLLTPRDHS